MAVGSKILLILFMFIGQLGILPMMRMFTGREHTSKYVRKGQLIEERLPIG
jgi:Trk-type K+ transport system membrane component